MSVEAMLWAFRSDAPSGPRFVLLAIANFANEDHECWPSVAKLVRFTGYSKATVHRYLTALEDGGYLRREHRSDAAGQRSSNRYVLPVDGPESQPETTPPRSQGSAPESQLRTAKVSPVSQEPKENPKRIQHTSPPADAGDAEDLALIPPENVFALHPKTVDRFDEFWTLYPRRVGKKAARAEWDKALKRAGAGEIIEALKARLHTFSPDPTKILYPERWLKYDRWEDELVSTRTTTTESWPTTMPSTIYHGRAQLTPDQIEERKRIRAEIARNHYEGA